jgi:hypothetical protein
MIRLLQSVNVWFWRLRYSNIQRLQGRGKIGSLVHILTRAPDDLAVEASACLENMGASAAIALVDALKHAHGAKDARTTQRISETLIRLKGDAVESLLGVVTGTMWQTPFRYSSFGAAALDVLVDIGEPAIGPLVKMLDGGMLTPVVETALLRIGKSVIPVLEGYPVSSTGQSQAIDKLLTRLKISH